MKMINLAVVLSLPLSILSASANPKDDEFEKIATPRGEGRSMTSVSPYQVAQSNVNFTYTGADWMGPLPPMQPLAERVTLLRSIRGVGEVTALTWALEVCDPQRFPSIGDAVSYCGLTSALDSSADKAKRGPISKQRNAHLQTVLVEAAKLAPRWNAQLAAVHEKELQRGHRNRATLEVARKLVAYLLAVDKSGKPFEARQLATPGKETEKVA